MLLELFIIKELKINDELFSKIRDYKIKDLKYDTLIYIYKDSTIH